MKPPELIKILEGLPQDLPILCQVVDKLGNAWNMGFHLSTHGSWNVLTVDHPELIDLYSSWERPEGARKP